MRTRAIHNNCPLGCLYLLLRGTGKAWVLAPGGNWLIPWHMGVLTKRGHFLNFRRLLPHEQNPFGAWWFLGSFQGVGRSRWRAVLSRRGKIKVIPCWAGLALLLVGYLVLFVPFVLSFAMFGPLWTCSWAVRALAKRWRVKQRIEDKVLDGMDWWMGV